MSAQGLPSHTTDDTDLSLLERMRTDEESAWTDFVRLYQPLLLHWCLRSLDHNDAEDVCQSILQTVRTKLRTFNRHENGSFRGWLRVVTRNRIIDTVRRQDRHPDPVGGTTAAKRLHQLAENQLTGDEEQHERHLLLSEAVEIIKPQFEERTWSAFWMSVVEEHPTGDICSWLQMKPGAIRMARHRVLHRLRDQLGDLVE